MPPKRQKPELSIVPALLLSPWMSQTVEGILYWVHVATLMCGIHIRGLALLCGVNDGVIRNAIRNVKKVDDEVRQIRTSSLYKLLKNKDIFLEEVRQIGSNPLQKGGPVKVICADVCTIFIRYYAEKGNATAMKTALKFMDFGIEQYIFAQVGFIPRPESIVIDEIDYLIAKETIQVNKSRQEEARFFTNPITGECGIDVPSLGFLCGGVALKHINSFLES